MRGLRGSACREGGRGRGVRRGVGNVLAQEHQLLHRGKPRARAADLRGGRCPRRPRARLHFVRAGVPVRRRSRPGASRATSRRRSTRWDAYEVSLGDTIGAGTAGKTKALAPNGRGARSDRGARRAFPRHLRSGAHQRLRGDGNGRGDVRLLGRGTRRLSLCEGRNRQSSRARTSSTCSTGSASRPGVDMTRLRVAGQFISDVLGRPPVSRVARALAAKSPLATA